jgi:hypothetical protein
MLRGVGKPLPLRRMPGLVHHGGGGACRTASACAGEARGAAPTETAAPMMAVAALIGVQRGRRW